MTVSTLGDVAVPVLLLKTKSTPGDAYEDLFARTTITTTTTTTTTTTPNSTTTFAPRFVPVLSHSFFDNGMNSVRDTLKNKGIGTEEGREYGGIIFTSQRAVEGFTKLVQDGKATNTDPSWPHLQSIPVYSVGPATTRTLSAVPSSPPLQVFGSHTGNGATLAPYILEHYKAWYPNRPRLPPLLFLVGEQRRDIIPKTLTDPNLADDVQIPVTETVVYGTGVMESFPVDFDATLKETEECPVRWVVVFSPTGCDSMLRGMGVLDDATGKVRPGARDPKTLIATIGPTTRDHLRSFGYEPEVCAESPTPEGVLEGIQAFMSSQKSS